LSLSLIIEYVKQHPDFRDAFVHHRYLPAQEAVYGEAPPLPPELAAVPERLGITRLYCHQSEALRLLDEGRSVVVATPTASGKTLVYTLAVLKSLLDDPESRHLYLSPLKALARDQIKQLAPWFGGALGSSVRAEVYDGDTSAYARKKTRSAPPEVLLTNPDMLHRGILAYHESWKELFSRLRYVILDEVHAYRGIFGSHVNQIIRRLKRVSLSYGASPRFILLSATVHNPAEFSRDLIGEDVAVVEAAGAPRAGQHVVLLNPLAESPSFLSAKLFAECIRRGRRTIAFTQARVLTELMHVWVTQLCPELKDRVSSYRAGFMPEERRVIERQLARGKLLGVISTSALEMGIDIGNLDVCILVGYPGTMINTWQRGGRVGRAGRESLIVLFAKPDALDQYFMKHPEAFFERSFEAAVLDPDNTYVVEKHLPCAAAELPVTLEDRAYWGEGLPLRLDKLEQAGELVRSADDPPTWFPGRRTPHLQVDIRSAGEPFTIFDAATGEAVGTIDGIRAFKECHPGAVYLHRASQYLVDDLILSKRDIVAHREQLKYYTRARSEKETEILRIQRSKPAGQFIVRQGELKVTEVVTGFEKRAMPGQTLMGVYPLELPPTTFETVGFWIEIDAVIKDFVERKGLHFMGGIHAIEHASIGMFPLFALCDRNDVGGICYPHHPQVGKSAVFIYDGHPGGVGLAQRGFDMVMPLLEKTYEHVRDCGCEEGCPSCIHSPKCGSGNKPLDKAAALLILEGLIGRIPLSDMAVPEAEESPAPAAAAEPALSPEPRRGPRILYFDLETRKTAQEVGGWRNTHLMRVAVAVLFDAALDRFAAYREEELDALIAHLQEAELIVGFNILRFDYAVLGAYTNIDLRALPTFDILEDLHRRIGFRLGLGHLASETLESGKTADGLQAVEWFRQGEWNKLTEYCQNDVAVTRDLFQFGLDHGHLVYREKREQRRVRLPVDWRLEDLLKRTPGDPRKE